MRQPDISAASAFLRANAAAREQVAGSALLHTLRQDLRTVDVDGDQFWLAEGDMLLDEDQLGVYALAREQTETALRLARATGFGFAGPPNPWLLGMTEDGKIVRWAPGVVLTYRIARDTFTSEANYRFVQQAMSRATLDWQNTCGITFEHHADLDALAGTQSGGVIFVVRQIDAGGAFIASAFFANDPISRRRVLIDASFFDMANGFDPAGVLRHELGHVLGFRHEHIRSGAPPVCPGESLGDTVELTQYDPQSVMHYFCGNVGSKDLRITALDRAGSQQIYGPPLDSVQFIER